MITVDFSRKILYDNIILPIRRTPRPHRETGFSEDAAKHRDNTFHPLQNHPFFLCFSLRLELGLCYTT